MAIVENHIDVVRYLFRDVPEEAATNLDGYLYLVEEKYVFGVLSARKEIKVVRIPDRVIEAESVGADANWETPFSREISAGYERRSVEAMKRRGFGLPFGGMSDLEKVRVLPAPPRLDARLRAAADAELRAADAASKVDAGHPA